MGHDGSGAEWNGEPEELMRRLLRIEQEQGRTRLVHWGPRTLDLDVIWGEHIMSDSALLRLPHPFFWERAFVLVPMAEIAPGFADFGAGFGKDGAADRMGLGG